MTWRRTRATAGRVLRQLRHDPRTVALLVAVPAVLMGLLAWILHGRDHDFDTFGPQLLGIFPLIVMFLVTSVATLRERTGGTLNLVVRGAHATMMQHIAPEIIERVNRFFGWQAIGRIALRQAPLRRQEPPTPPPPPDPEAIARMAASRPKRVAGCARAPARPRACAGLKRGGLR